MSYSEFAGQPTLVEVRCKAKNGRCWTLIAALLSDGTVVEAGTERVLDRLDDESENVSIGPGCKYHRNSYRDRTGRPMNIGEQRIFVDRLIEARQRALATRTTEEILWVPWDL